MRATVGGILTYPSFPITAGRSGYTFVNGKLTKCKVVSVYSDGRMVVEYKEATLED